MNHAEASLSSHGQEYKSRWKFHFLEHIHCVPKRQLFQKLVVKAKESCF